MRQAGQKAEELVERLIKECLKPSKQRSHIPTGAAGSKRTIDHLASLEKITLKIETKTKIPLGGPAMTRAKNQMKELSDNLQKDEKGVLLGVVERVSDQRLECAIRHLTKFDSTGQTVYVFNGAMSFLAWAGEMYADYCSGQ